MGAEPAGTRPLPGGFSTKIHLKTDWAGDPLGFHLAGGEASDSPHFETLLDLGPDITPRVAVGDKGYDAKANRQAARSRGICPAIPYRKTTNNKPTFFPKALYRGRARIEQTMGKLKRFKRGALRCERTDENYGLASGKILLANASCTCWKCHEGDKGGLTRSCERCAREPSTKPNEVHGGSRQHMLEMRLGKPDVARASQVQSSDPGRDRSLDAGALLVLSGEGRLRLAFASRLQCLVFLLRAQREKPPAAPGTLCLQRTGATVGRREAHLEGSPFLPVIRKPAPTLVPAGQIATCRSQSKMKSCKVKASPDWVCH